MSKLAFEAPIIPITPASDLTLRRGCFIGTTLDIVANYITVLPLGCIVDGSPITGKTSVAVAPIGILKVKLSAAPGAVVLGSILALDSATPGAVKLSPGSGTARVEVARALEAGAANELIDAVLIHPAAGV